MLILPQQGADFGVRFALIISCGPDQKLPQSALPDLFQMLFCSLGVSTGKDAVPRSTTMIQGNGRVLDR